MYNESEYKNEVKVMSDKREKAGIIEAVEFIR